MHTESHACAEARRGLVLVMCAAVIWGTVGVTTKAIFGVATTTPLSVGFWRLALAVPMLWLGCWRALGRRMLHVAWGDIVGMALMGGMMALYQVCYFAAIERVGVAVAVLTTLCSAPVIVAMLSARVTGERLTAHKLLALGCALAGTVMLIDIQPNGGTPATTMSGVVLALVSAFCYAVVTLASCTLAGRYHPFQTIAIGFSCGATLLGLCALPTGFGGYYPAVGWVLLVYLGLVPTALAYWVFLAGMRHTPATTASVVTLLEPLTSTALAWLLYDERFSALGVLGMLLLLSAIALLYGGNASK
jgi:drug/metabolite transporter, DME family